MMRVGVLASGTGSNLQALIDQLNVEGSVAKVVVAICNVPNARALERAQQADLAAVLMQHEKWPDRPSFDAAIADELGRHQVDLVCLAGWMRLVTPALLNRFPGRVLNIHPALLPSFPGLHAPRQALEKGVKVTGCTVHFVDEGTDTGPIIAQAAVPVLPDDDIASLTARIQREEHRLYAATVRAIAAGKVTLEGRTVKLTEPVT